MYDITGFLLTVPLTVEHPALVHVLFYRMIQRMKLVTQ